MKGPNRRLLIVCLMNCLALGSLTGCSETTGTDVNVQCERTTIDDTEYCTYSQPITETGYDCPPDLPNAVPMGPGTACAGAGPGGGGGDIPPNHEDELIDHMDNSSQPGDPDQPNQPRSSSEIDILWVIDNSGSMCQEQASLRQNFDQFIGKLIDRDVDFHIGVTTTQMDEFPLEPVAKPGQIQSTPQPLPSSLPECRGDEEDPNNPMDGFGPIRQAIDQAVACTEQPSQWAHLVNLTDDEIECQLVPGLQGCSCNDDPNDADICKRDNLFPTYQGDTSPYRDIPKVLRASDYRNPQTGQLDAAAREQLRDDFACASFVGTSGYSIEKGLAAAAKAVSPQMTGGTVENPTDKSAPNFGLLRDDAKFSVIFVTDENDCSHDGTLDEGTYCGGDLCAFVNHPDYEDSPLVPSSALAEELKSNLSNSKGYQVTTDAVVAASIHGRWKRYGAVPRYPDGEPLNQTDCEALSSRPSEDVVQKTSCNSTEFGTAYSGDRYERYLREFDPDQVFPAIPSDPDAHMEGLICQPNLVSDMLEQIGQTLADSLP